MTESQKNYAECLLEGSTCGLSRSEESFTRRARLRASRDMYTQDGRKR